MNDNKILTLKEQDNIYGVLLNVAAKLSILNNIDIDEKIDEFFIDGIKVLSKDLKKDVVSCIDLISSKEI